MPYPITIGITVDGSPIVGARECRKHSARETERVYGSQLPHRCVARDEDGVPHLTTPTEARNAGWTIIHRTPYARQ